MEWFWWLMAIFFLLWLMERQAEVNRIKKRRKEAGKFEPVIRANPNSAASSRWASDKLLRAGGYFKGKGWRIGLSQSGKPLHYGGPGHICLTSPARTLKFVSILGGAMLERPNPMASRCLIDPKGELCAVTHAKAAEFSEVVAVDPFGTLKKLGVKGVRIVGFNPLSVLDAASISLGGDVDSITDGVFAREAGGGENSAFFDDSAAGLHSVGIRVLVKYGRQEEKNLVAVRDAICRDVFGFAAKYAYCGDAVAEAEFSRYTSRKAADSKSIDDIVSTFRTQTAFIGMEGIRESLMADGLRWRDLKRKPMTVYLILPLDKLGTGATKWFRLCMSTGLNELLKAGPRGLPVLWVIDEFFSVNNPPLKTFQAAMSQAAGAAKMQVLVVLQDLAQLQTMYPHGQGWRTFLSNSAVKIFFGGPMLDKETSEYIAQMCGEQEVIVSSRNVSDDKARRVGDLYDVNIGDGAAVAWQPLIRPHEVRRMSASEMIVFAEKVGAPIFGKRKPYWETHRGYRPNPYYNGGGGGLFGIFR